MADRKLIAEIATWLKGLADLCVHPAGQDPTKAKLLQMAEALAEVLPSGAFTAASARECAKGDFFPGFDSIEQRARAWWDFQQTRRATRAVGGGGAHGLTGMDLHWCNYFHNRQAENFYPPPQHIHPDNARAHLLGLIRRESLPAWRVITGNTEPTRREPTEYDRERIAATARLARTVASQAAMPYVPASAPVAAQLAALPPPDAPAPQASPDVLAAREANPIVQAAKRHGLFG
jgi:hypothetical protein